MYRYLVVGLSIWVIASMVLAEGPEIEWEATFGDVDADYAYWVEVTPDSGYVIAGYSYEFESEDTEQDMFVVRTDRNGHAIWEKTYGGEKWDRATRIMVTDDDGYMLLGTTLSYSEGWYDIRMFKLSPTGQTEWDKGYGEGWDSYRANDFCRLLDGNYLVAGNSPDGIYVFKINSSGDLLNEVTIDIFVQEVEAIVATADGGAMIVSNGQPFALLKVDASGNRTWHKAYASGSSGRSVIQLDDGGYVACGWREYGGLDDDFYLVRVDDTGKVIWEQHYGNQYSDQGYCVRQTSDGGFILAGRMFPPSGDEWSQVWVIRTNSAGDTLWTKTFGGAGMEDGYCIQPTPDNGYIVVGFTDSFGEGATDCYLVKLGPDPVLPTDINDEPNSLLPNFALRQNYPNPFNPSTEIEFDLQRRSVARLTIYNILGQEVRKLVDAELSAGHHTVTWDGSDDAGKRVSTGIYFYRFETEGYSESRKMVLFK